MKDIKLVLKKIVKKYENVFINISDKYENMTNEIVNKYKNVTNKISRKYKNIYNKISDKYGDKIKKISQKSFEIFKKININPLLDKLIGDDFYCPNKITNTNFNRISIKKYNSKENEGGCMKEYKVLSQKDKWFSGKFDPQLLEQAINSYAQQGWKVVTAVTADIPSFISGPREECLIILERDCD